MRQLLIILLLLNVEFTFGQSFSYPNIVSHGKNITNFIPNHWTLLDSATGDLSNDQNNDIALIIQYNDSVSLVNKEDGYSDTVITQPRILLIAFYDPVMKQYKLMEQSNTFILNHDNPNMEEPFQEISIVKGVLTISFQIFMNAGGWDMSSNGYKFRYANNEFVLIGADYNTTNRASGEIENRSYNFLTKKVKISTGNISTDIEKGSWRTFRIDKLKTFRTFTKPFTWEVEKDYYL